MGQILGRQRGIADQAQSIEVIDCSDDNGTCYEVNSTFGEYMGSAINPYHNFEREAIWAREMVCPGAAKYNTLVTGLNRVNEERYTKAEHWAFIAYSRTRGDNDVIKEAFIIAHLNLFEYISTLQGNTFFGRWWFPTWKKMFKPLNTKDKRGAALKMQSSELNPQDVWLIYPDITVDGQRFVLRNGELENELFDENEWKALLPPVTNRELIDRIVRRCTGKNYNIFNFNCQHFAIKLLSDENHSLNSELSWKTIFQVLKIFLSDHLYCFSSLLVMILLFILVVIHSCFIKCADNGSMKIDIFK